MTPDLLAEMPGPVALVATAVVGFAIFQTMFRIFFKRRDSLDAIPSVGIPSYPFGFYVGAYNSINNARVIPQEGYLKHRGKAFKVAMANRWLVLISGRTLIEELHKSPDEFVSITEATHSLLQMEHTIGHEQHRDTYQVAVMRTPMTRNISVRFPDIRDEIVSAFRDLLTATEGIQRLRLSAGTGEPVEPVKLNAIRRDDEWGDFSRGTGVTVYVAKDAIRQNSGDTPLLLEGKKRE
ncbi:hypothetical protein DFH06DRAFT_1306107 [Mycena polygramma]|nr:hypothetical protein DFH06DRAFT_1306107 [Mycena polygramma]